MDDRTKGYLGTYRSSLAFKRRVSMREVGVGIIKVAGLLMERAH